MRRVKIVCTMGPATAGVERLQQLIAAGMDVARLNLSHGDHESHRRMYLDLREAARRSGKALAVLLDLSGPKIRVGDMLAGGVALEKGALVTLTPEPALGTPQRVSHSYLPLARDVRAGDPILLDDGLMKLSVERVEGQEVVARVIDGGTLKSHKGMNLPGTALSTPALTDKDKADIAFGRALGVDYFALSFVRQAADLVEAKALAGPIPVIAKIEKPEAVQNLEAILDACDGAMVARGDLGVEFGHEKVPLIQKRILREVQPRAKPAITATQMLDSMVHNPRPTRAEVSDVANAVLDGTDAVMLSAETSVGAYPVEAVRMLASIIEEIERHGAQELGPRQRPPSERTFSNSIADAAAEVAAHLELAAVAVYTETGRSAQLVSAHRPKANLVALSRHDAVLQKLALYWGVLPVHGDWVRGVDGVVAQTEQLLLQAGLARPGDNIAITFGMVLRGEPFETNMLKLWKVTAR